MTLWTVAEILRFQSNILKLPQGFCIFFSKVNNHSIQEEQGNQWWHKREEWDDLKI